MVRILYRGDYREIAAYLDSHPHESDVAVASTLMGPWDRVALDVDTQGDDAHVRLFDPRRALVWTGDGGPTSVILTFWPPAAPEIDDILQVHTISSERLSAELQRHEVAPLGTEKLGLSQTCLVGHRDRAPDQERHIFGNGLELTEVCRLNQAPAGSDSDVTLLTVWAVPTALDLPAMPLIANPPPPGVYAGPRLVVFAHLLASDPLGDEIDASGEMLAADDGLWVDPLTLRPGDRFIQIHRFSVDEESAAEYSWVRLGLYDPMAEERWAVLDAEGRPTEDGVVVRLQDLQ